MSEHVIFLLLGVGNGAVYAALAMALVVTFRSSGVVNFSTGAIALYVAYTFVYLRRGELLIPIPGLPETIRISDSPIPVGIAMTVALAVAAAMGLLLYWVVFRRIRNASPVAKAVASIGIMLVTTSILAVRVGTNPVATGPILPTGAFVIGDHQVPQDRILFAALIIAIGLALAALIKFTRFGLATRAIAESERGGLVSGLSPDRIAAANWALSTVVAGVSGILIAPIVPLVPVAYTLFIVPALAAAITGGFTRLGPAMVAGLAIGMLQSEAVYLQSTVDWMPSAGIDKIIPLVLVLVFLLGRGGGIPQRTSIAQKSGGRAPLPRNVTGATLLGVGFAAALLFATSGSWRAAVLTTIIMALLALSQVVVTGYAGQVSLAQLALAGVSAYILARVMPDWGITFPLAPILAALITVVVGVLVGLPALRLRGLPVAIVTLAMAVAVQSAWFENPSFNGGTAGARVDAPQFLGLDLSIGSGLEYPRLAFCLFCLLILAIVGVGVAFLRRSSLGAQMLAVRANEKSASAAGIDVRRTKVIAFAVAAFIAGLAGALLAYQQQVATADTYAALVGIGFFAVVYLAGVSSILGGLTAGFLASGGVSFLIANRFLGLDSYYLTISGLFLVLNVVLYPEGVVGPIHEWLAKRRRARGAAPPGSDVAIDEQPEGRSVDRVAGPPLLTVRNLSVRYGGVVAVDDVSFTVNEGEILGIIGPNGAGKTTLLDALSGFVGCTGSVVLLDMSVNGLAAHERARSGLGRTFQSLELWDDLTVEENVKVGRAARPAGDTQSVDDLLNALSLGGFREQLISDMSQGHRQLVSVARALAGSPRVVLLDEPAAGLDSTTSLWLGERLKAVRDYGTTVVMIEHDVNLVLATCDRIVVLDLGRKIADGDPEEIRNNPAVIEAYLGSGVGDVTAELDSAPERVQ